MELVKQAIEYISIGIGTVATWIFGTGGGDFIANAIGLGADIMTILVGIPTVILGCLKIYEWIKGRAKRELKESDIISDDPELNEN